MGRDVGVPGRGLLDDRPELLLGVLCRLSIGSWGDADPAGHHDLDLRRTEAQLVTRRLPHPGDPVRDPRGVARGAAAPRRVRFPGRCGAESHRARRSG